VAAPTFRVPRRTPPQPVGAMRPAERRRRKRNAITVAGVIVLAPVIAVLVLRIPLINQLNDADAWFYSSYAWVPKHQFAVFGWNYFSVRFPAILSIGVSERLFGVGGGYVVLRYLLAIVSGFSLYLCVRRFASVRVAIGAVLLLYLQPFFSRMLLWDYSVFLEVSVGLIGVALWYWSDGRPWAWTLLPGIALAAAVFANGLFVTAVLALLVVEGVAALRQGRRASLIYASRVATTAAAAFGVFCVGYLGYLTILGHLSPYELLRPTIEFVGESEKNSAPYVRPISSWLLHEPRVWAPIITSVALLAVLRRRIFGVGLEMRIAQLCVAFTAFLWLYRLTLTSSVVESWWAYSIVVVAMAPGVGVLLHELGQRPGHALRWMVAGVGAFFLTALLVRNIGGPAGDFYRAISTHTALFILLLAIGLASALLMATPRMAYRGAALALFLIVLALMSYAPSILDDRGTTGVFVANSSQEWTAYKAGKRFMEIVQDYDNPAHRVFLWFPGTLGDVDITWADLPQEGNTLNELGVSESLTQLTPLARARLLQPQVKYVMILAPRPSEVATARGVLASAGFGGPLVRGGRLAGNALNYALVALPK